MSSIPSVKGTRDFYPEHMAFRRWLYDSIRRISESFGYMEYEAPLIERFELYAAKSGEELVNEQSFVFEDRGGDRIVLRPELTLSLARMIAELKRNREIPIRWWSFGPFWRYERPQRGRSREFFQWNIDLLGIDSPFADAEIVAIIAAFFDGVGLSPKKAKILINNRRLADSQLKKAGFTSNVRGDLFRFIDRRDKLKREKWHLYGRKLGLTEENIAAVEALLDDREAWKTSDEMTAFFAACESFGISDYLSYDPTVIRGLDYYTGTVFEARDTTEAERAILGGGRYDDLVADVGGDPLPGVGFAMGDVVFQLVLEANDLSPDLAVNPSQVLVTIFDETLLPASITLARDLRRERIKVEWYPVTDRLNKQLRYADRQAIPFVCILGPDEMRNDTVTLKIMSSGDQMTVKREALSRKIQSLLEPQMP